MTLKELLDRCDFKDIVPVIVKHYPETPWAVVDFKGAFDILRHLEPEKNPANREELRLVACFDESSQTTYPGISRWFELGEWKDELSSEIIVDDKLTLTDAEIAYHCLWELTYLGFDQSSTKKWEEAQMNILGKGFEYISESDSSPIKKEPDPLNPYTVAVEELESKSNIDENDEQQIKKLTRMARVEEDIRSLTSNTKSFKREELEYLFKTNLITFRNRRSFAFNLSQRIDYLIDLFSNYDMTDYSPNTHFLLMFRTSSAYPFDQRELDMIQGFFSQFLPASANIRYGYGNDENLDTEVSLLLLGSY